MKAKQKLNSGKKMDRGFFITIEGTDGSGKTTQINLIKQYLINKGFEVIFIREPGGTEISEKIRLMLLDNENKKMHKKTEMLLYASARAQLVAEIIKPALNEGKIIICDRFVDSSYAYQGFGRDIGLEEVIKANESAIGNVMPDVTFFFDISPEEALKRKTSNVVVDRIENEDLEFHKKVYQGYKELAMLYPERIVEISASRSVDDVFDDVKEFLDKKLEAKRH